MTSYRPFLVSLGWVHTAIAATLAACLALLMSLAAPVQALDPNQRLTQYIHTAWRTQDGSAPAGMLSISQTSDGFLWFASLSGDIYRFDGVQFLPWHLPAGLSMSFVNGIFGDHAGGLWLAGDGLVHVKDGIVTSRFALGPMGGFQYLSQDHDGSLWVVRGSNGVTEPLCHVADHGIKCFGKADGIPISPLNSLLADGKGGFWLGGQTALVHWHGGASEVYPIAALKSHVGQPGITSLARGPDGSLWVGIGAEGPGLGLCQLKEGIVKPFVTPTFDGSRVDVFSTILDRDGNLWVASFGKGVFRIHGNIVEHYQHTDGLSGDSVTVLFEDREGIIWAAATSGIDSFRSPRVTTFSAMEGLPKDAAVGVLASRDGTIWVASDDSLDHIDKNGTVSSIRTGSGLPGHQVAALLEDHSRNLWVGVDDGLYVLKDGHFRRVAEPDHQPLGMVLALAEDTGGNIWAECASNPRKLVRIRDFGIREVFSASQIPPGRTLAPDPRGGIWIGTLRGDIALLRNGVLQTQFPLNPGDLSNRQIIAKADGSVLAGSKNGLVGWRAGKVQRMTMKNGLPCDFVISFIEDTNKRWWLYTRCGVVELSDSELQRWWADPEAVVQTRVYDVLDGARPATPPFNSAAVSPDGRVWFATTTVVQMVDPSSVTKKALPAETYIESVVAERKKFETAPNLRVPPNPRDLEIDYTSPTFSIPQKVKFRYRLDKYDRDWHEAGTRRQAFYTDLPPGKYSFRVTASNSDGVWNENAAKLDFSVTPAYYQTNWFRAASVAVFLLLLWAIYQYRLHQMARQFQSTLDTRVAERTRLARDLHDTLLQSFHGVLLYFQSGINLLPEDSAESRTAEARKTLEKAMHQAKHAIVEGREAIQGLRSSVVETNDLALAVRTLGQELAADSNSAAFQVHVEGTPRDLHPILRDEVYRITGEGIRNAFRHADAKQIEVEIHYDDQRLRVRVRDNGKGLDPKLLSDHGREGHFGLQGMRERAKLIGGRLTVWSELDAGTEAELSIPASRAYTVPTAGNRMRIVDKFLAKLSGQGTAKKP